MSMEKELRAPRKSRGMALALVCVLLGVPLILAVWIALIFAAEWLQIPTAPHIIFAWLLSLIVAAVLWPMSMRGMRRYYWAARATAVDDLPSWGSQRYKAEPKIRLSLGQIAARSAAVVVGMPSLLLICGPWEISGAILSALNLISAGSSSWWSAVQLCTWLLAMFLFLPTLWVTGRRLKRAGSDSARRHDLLIDQNWWLSAATSWAICMMMGLIFSWLAVDKLS